MFQNTSNLSICHQIQFIIHCKKMKFSVKDFFSKCDQILSFITIIIIIFLIISIIIYKQQP